MFYNKINEKIEFNMKKLLVIIFLIFPLLLQAADNYDYIVNNIRITKVDKDATTARQKAMFQGQRDAFDVILSRLNIDLSNSILISDSEISETIRSMQIKNERITNNSYSANLMVEFSPDYFSYILNKYKISKYSPKLNSYLIVPILNESGETYLWEKNNRWFSAFKKNLIGNKNMVLVGDDYSSRNAIDKDNFKDPTYSKFKDVTDLYNVNNVVIVTGNYNKNGDLIKIKIKIMDPNKTKNVSLNYEVENLNNVNIDFSGAAVKIIDYIDSLSEAEKIQEDNSKSLNLEVGSIYMFVPISSIVDYNNIRNMLNNNKSITELKLKMLTKNMAIYSIKFYNNDTEFLIKSLKSQGFSISQKKDGLYIFYK